MSWERFHSKSSQSTGEGGRPHHQPTPHLNCQTVLITPAHGQSPLIIKLKYIKQQPQPHQIKARIERHEEFMMSVERWKISVKFQLISQWNVYSHFKSFQVRYWYGTGLRSNKLLCDDMKTTTLCWSGVTTRGSAETETDRDVTTHNNWET